MKKWVYRIITLIIIVGLVGALFYVYNKYYFNDFVKALELASARTDSQASAASGNVSSQNANASVTSGNTTAQTAAKTAPLTGYTFGEASAPASGDETTFILVAGMMFALALGTTIVYTKSRVSKKKEEK